jgi:hypothetical protein
VRKRLLIGLLSAGLLGAMLRGVAGADSSANLGQCVAKGTNRPNSDDSFWHVGRNGAQHWILPKQASEAHFRLVAKGLPKGIVDEAWYLVSCPLD